jgi:hypothetical protein
MHARDPGYYRPEGVYGLKKNNGFEIVKNSFWSTILLPNHPSQKPINSTIKYKE